MKVLDLFSGIGGFALGFDETKTLKTEQFVEINPFCQKILKQRWPLVPIHSDIETFTGTGFDVIVGGFPCQDISVAGKGLGLAGQRSGLWSHFFRLIELNKPKYVVIENVKALVSRGLQDVLEDLASVGYDAEWNNFPAACFGLPQARERIWIVAYPCGHRESGLITSQDISEARQRWSSSEADLQSIVDFATIGGESFPQPLLRRVDDRPSDWAHRVTACGNAVTPRITSMIAKAIEKDITSIYTP